jgi:uncharacterized protein (TIGR02757 family)
MSEFESVRDLLERKYLQFNHPDFIVHDPVSIPHRFSIKQDIEISGLFAAVFAWGQRKTIIAKSLELMQLMDNSPYDFVSNHSVQDLKNLEKFKHRTFTPTDTLYFIEFLKRHYARHDSLEPAFLRGKKEDDLHVKSALTGFYDYFFSLEDYPERTRKHISTPAKNSACKRMNMYLRWMVRKDEKGVDFGIWQNISSSQLICPCDVHVERVARRLNMVSRAKADWLMAEELTRNLATMDKNDPVKYDFALFGLGIEKYF